MMNWVDYLSVPRAVREDSTGLFCTPTSNKDGIFLRKKGKKGEFCATFSHDPLFRDYIDYI